MSSRKSCSKRARKRHAEEELNLLSGLTQSLCERQKKRQKNDSNGSDNAISVFGQYVSQTLAEFDPKVRHLAQNKINNILFQAQMGMLGLNETNQLNSLTRQPNWQPMCQSVNVDPASSRTLSGFYPNHQIRGATWPARREHINSDASLFMPQQDFLPSSPEFQGNDMHNN